MLDAALYGLHTEEIHRLRRFLLAWCEDLSMRLAERDHLSPGVVEAQSTGYPED